MKIEEKVLKFDKAGMFERLKNFPNQILESINIAEKTSTLKINSKKFVLLGMGGSAIAGDLLQAYFRNSTHADIELFVNRNYHLMRNIDANTNVIASSYSGNTEETLEAYKYAKNHTNNIFGITCGGKLKEMLLQDGFPVVGIPSGFQPREALGFSFFTLLLLILKSYLNEEKYLSLVQHLKRLSNFLTNKSEEYSAFEKSRAYKFAVGLKDKILIIYASEETMLSVAMRIKAQIQENAKNLCFAGYIPEMNHNEINSFMFPKDILKRIKVILLKDKNDHPQNQKRIVATNSILATKVEVEIIESPEEDFLFRIFDIIYFFDWVSFYLAIENEIDPTAIETISELKKHIQG